MANERILRNRKNTSSSKATTNIATNSTAQTSSNTRSSTSSSNSSNQARISDARKASTSRLSTSTAKSPAISVTTNAQVKIKELESRLFSLESSFSVLVTENTELKRLIDELAVDLTNIKAQNQDLASQLQSHRNIQPDQHRINIHEADEQLEINGNIVIRGPEVSETTPEADLRLIYEGLRNHLGVSNVHELDPVSVSVIASGSTEKNLSSRPIVVKLTSIEAKKKLLQVRRSKKEIFTPDIGINNNPRRLLLVSEQLTKSNQELLYQARSLRGENGFKFVWSSNGQILARQKPNTKVTRIFDTAHVNRLKTEFNLHQENGRHSS